MPNYSFNVPYIYVYRVSSPRTSYGFVLSSNRNLHGRVNSSYLHVKNCRRKLVVMSYFAEWALILWLYAHRDSIAENCLRKDHTTWSMLANDDEGTFSGELRESPESRGVYHLPKIHSAFERTYSFPNSPQFDSLTNILKLNLNQFPPLKTYLFYHLLFLRPPPRDKLIQNTPAPERHRSSLIRTKRTWYFSADKARFTKLFETQGKEIVLL